MIVYTHNDCLKKFNGQNHPERKERLDSIIESMQSLSDFKINFKEAPLAKLNDITLVHPKEHIDTIFSNIPKEGLLGLEKEPFADTMLCPDSKNAILRSCGAGIAAVDDLMLNIIKIRNGIITAKRCSINSILCLSNHVFIHLKFRTYSIEVKSPS